MADKMELLLEAERRGILPDDRKELLAEARRRGLVAAKITGEKKLGAMDVIGGAVKNFPGDVWNVAKSVVKAVTHPSETLEGLSDVGAGAMAKMLPESAFKTTAEAQAMRQQTEGAAEQFGGHYKERYGGLENIKRSIAEHPAETLLDVSMIAAPLARRIPSLKIGGKTLTPEMKGAAELAKKEGIPLSASSLAPTKTAKAFEWVGESLPPGKWWAIRKRKQLQDGLTRMMDEAIGGLPAGADKYDAGVAIGQGIKTGKATIKGAEKAAYSKWEKTLGGSEIKVNNTINEINKIIEGTTGEQRAWLEVYYKQAKTIPPGDKKVLNVFAQDATTGQWHYMNQLKVTPRGGVTVPKSLGNYFDDLRYAKGVTEGNLLSKAEDALKGVDVSSTSRFSKLKVEPAKSDYQNFWTADAVDTFQKQIWSKTWGKEVDGGKLLAALKKDLGPEMSAVLEDAKAASKLARAFAKNDTVRQVMRKYATDPEAAVRAMFRTGNMDDINVIKGVLDKETWDIARSRFIENLFDASTEITGTQRAFNPQKFVKLFDKYKRQINQVMPEKFDHLEKFANLSKASVTDLNKMTMNQFTSDWQKVAGLGIIAGGATGNAVVVVPAGFSFLASKSIMNPSGWMKKWLTEGMTISPSRAIKRGAKTNVLQVGGREAMRQEEEQ